MKNFFTFYYLLSTLIITIFYNCNAQSYLILTNTIITEKYSSRAKKVFRIEQQVQGTDNNTKENMKKFLDEIFKSDKNRKIPRDTSVQFSSKPENELWKFTREKGNALIQIINENLSNNFKDTFHNPQERYKFKEVSEFEAKAIEESKAYQNLQIELNNQDENSLKKIPAFIELPTLFTKALHYLSAVKFPMDLESRKIKYQNKEDSSIITSHYFWIHQNDLEPKEAEVVHENPRDQESRELMTKETSFIK